MISHPFDVYMPDTLEEAVQAFTQVRAQEKHPVYYAGGSEVITMAQAGSIRPDAVIDLKRIPALNAMRCTGGRLHIGANVTLSAIHESGLFPLLGAACSRIADHTNQVRITLGGNLCGTVIYRETALPLLLSDAQLVFFGPRGERRAAMRDAFNGRVLREEDEILCGAIVDPAPMHAPFVHVKKTGDEKIGYPLVTVAALKREGRMLLAVSGLCDFPFRDSGMEAILNDAALAPRERALRMLQNTPAGRLDDLAASADFRSKVFADIVEDTIAALKEA